MLRRWWIACVLGEAIAVLVVTLVGVLVSRTVPEGSLVHPLSMPLTGALEGAIVGLAQGWALRPYGLSVRRFTLATSLAFALAWVGGAALSLLEPEAPPTFGLLLVAAGLAGVVVGALAGAAQVWTPLRDEPEARLVWIVASAAGWGAGMVASAVASDVIWGAFSLAVLGMETGKGAVVGALVAAVTGPLAKGTFSRDAFSETSARAA
ncbi:MAG: hypothetical protein H6722_22720 [Sandaracinus sp.]|nr:hypothetical protein [Sandaracinus sp.]MCB9622409.1 hypothetical protein [Sandaracinus sp.]